MPARWTASIILILSLFGLSGCGQATEPGGELLNVSYDPTRELYQDYNTAFAEHWKKATDKDIALDASHGGSGKQARKVIDGVEASVVTLALAYDVDAIAGKGLIAPDWQSRLPNHSCPYVSTIVLLVRQGNPKGIHDWNDLLQPDVKIITPHPKTSGGARWNYLAAWGYALNQALGDLKKLNDPKEAGAVAKATAKAKTFVKELYGHTDGLESGARDATLKFVRQGQGDVLIAWENEALLEVQGDGRYKFEVVVPSISVLAEPPVAVVDKVVDRLGTRKVAEDYVKYLYSPVGQTIAARNFYRPSQPKDVEKGLLIFKELKLFTVDDVFGGWKQAQQTHFDDKGVFDEIYKAEKK